MPDALPDHHELIPDAADQQAIPLAQSTKPAIAPKVEANQADEEEEQGGGVPLWMPLVGLIAAFLVAIFVGSRVFPTLSALIYPPDPRLPAGQITQTSHVQNGSGEDEWVYSTQLTGCDVALFYQDWLSDCSYDPDLSCQQGHESDRLVHTDPVWHVATCTGHQSVGAYSLNWTVYISTGYATGDKTIFRLVREITN